LVTKYFTCPYCTYWKGSHGSKVPKTIGKYRVKILQDYILIFQCQRCMKTFRVKMVGKILKWDDMSASERKTFKQKKWNKKK